MPPLVTPAVYDDFDIRPTRELASQILVERLVLGAHEESFARRLAGGPASRGVKAGICDLVQVPVSFIVPNRLRGAPAASCCPFATGERRPPRDSYPADFPGSEACAA